MLTTKQTQVVKEVKDAYAAWVVATTLLLESVENEDNKEEIADIVDTCRELDNMYEKLSAVTSVDEAMLRAQHLAYQHDLLTQRVEALMTHSANDADNK